jgi:hypothetical protein
MFDFCPSRITLAYKATLPLVCTAVAWVSALCFVEHLSHFRRKCYIRGIWFMYMKLSDIWPSTFNGELDHAQPLHGLFTLPCCVYLSQVCRKYLERWMINRGDIKLSFLGYLYFERHSNIIIIIYFMKQPEKNNSDI